MDTLLATIKAGFEKDHQNREYTIDEGVQRFMDYINNGGAYIQLGKVIIKYEEKNNICEFHCCNGGSGKDITSAVAKFLDVIKGDYPRAVTYYDNPRVNTILHFVGVPFETKKIDGGIDRTYETTFILGK